MFPLSWPDCVFPVRFSSIRLLEEWKYSYTGFVLFFFSFSLLILQRCPVRAQTRTLFVFSYAFCLCSVCESKKIDSEWKKTRTWTEEKNGRAAFQHRDRKGGCRKKEGRKEGRGKDAVLYNWSSPTHSFQQHTHMHTRPGVQTVCCFYSPIPVGISNTGYCFSPVSISISNSCHFACRKSRFIQVIILMLWVQRQYWDGGREGN